MRSIKKVILVNEKDEPIGLKEVKEAHKGKGILHRAFSIFVFNEKGELLLQQRSKQKFLWPGCWSDTCASHPQEGESPTRSASKRLKEELGFTCKLRYIGKLRYKANYKTIGAEKEVCWVFFGKYKGKIVPNPKEVAEIRWIPLQQLKRAIAQNPGRYTPWMKLQIKKFAKAMEHLL